MDFALSEEQELLRKSARDFLNTECPKSIVKEIEASELGYLPELWKKMAALGWMGLILPEEYGGADFNLLDLAVLFEEFGRAAMPGPMFSTIIGSLAIFEYGTEEQKKGLLPEVATGDIFLSLAIAEPEVNYDARFVATQAHAQNGGFAISGTKLFVPYASTADYLLVVARTQGKPGNEEGLTVFLVDGEANGLIFNDMPAIAHDKQCEVQFDKVPVSSADIVGSLNNGYSLITALLQKATAIQCAEMVGGAQRELEIAAEHTKTRIQFERPLGAFQAVQHRLADMFIDVNGARWTTYQAVWRLSDGLPAEREVAIAKAFTNVACQRIAASAQHLHGGIGVDVDYDLHYYFRRAKSFELNLGNTPFHLKTVEAEIGK